MTSSIRLKGRHALKSIGSTLDLRRVGKRHEKDTPTFNMSKAVVRRATHKSLKTIFTAVLAKDEEDLYLDGEAANDLCITLCDLELENDGPANQDGSFFFSPMSSDDLESFPFDRTDRATNSFLCSYDRWDDGKSTTTGYWGERKASDLAGQLAWLVEGGRRIFPKDNKQTYLYRAVNWKNLGVCPEILHEDLFNTIDRAGMLQKEGRVGSIFRITDGYCARVRVNEPHVIVMINHRYTADEKISRAETLAITAAMMTQLENERLEDHYIPPVMVVSFMDSLHGRILQAHVTDSALVIRKSKLYNFDKQEDFERSMTLFTRHMACDRIGNTRQYTLFDQEMAKRKAAEKKQLLKGAMATLSKDNPPGADPKFEGKD